MMISIDTSVTTVTKFQDDVPSFNIEKIKPHVRIEYQVKTQNLQSEEVAGIHSVRHREARDIGQSGTSHEAGGTW